MSNTWQVVINDSRGDEVVHSGASEREARSAYSLRAAIMHLGQATRLERDGVIINERRRA